MSELVLALMLAAPTGPLQHYERRRQYVAPRGCRRSRFRGRNKFDFNVVRVCLTYATSVFERIGHETLRYEPQHINIWLGEISHSE